MLNLPSLPYCYTPEHEAFRESLRAFVAQEITPYVNDWDEAGTFPRALYGKAAHLGLLGLGYPEAYGGIGLSMAQECRVAYELAQTALAFRSTIGTNVGIGSQGILFDGTEAQKAKYLPKLATGELIASFALTEPDAGSDAASLRTTAIRGTDAQGDHYIVNGTKRYITNSPHAGI